MTLGESDRAPQTHFEIDQEIFIDSVADGDVVEDATVATEVTLFDRVGDAYVLEGAIVFAGYTKRDELHEDEAQEEAGDALSFNLDEESVRHFHQRLPFVLRVPVKAQPRGIVNVNSRISSWKLEVVGAGWMRILGDLTVLGLNSHQGYHFQCGAQEEGDLFFQPSWSGEVGGYTQELHQVEDVRPDSNGDLEDAAEHSSYDLSPADNVPADQNSDPVSAYQLTRGEEGDGDIRQAYDGNHNAAQNVEQATDSGGADAISHARGGHESTDATGSEGPRSQTKAADNQEDFSSNELQRLDRLFGVKDDSEKSSVNSAKVVVEDNQNTDDNAPKAGKRAEDPTTESASRENVVEFDFEHQVADLGGVEESSGSAEELQVNPRSPEIVVGEHHEDATDERGEGVSTTPEEMWSFVDFNQPDTKYTLRYVIVMEEESLQEVSIRLDCSPDELIRLNKLDSDAIVHPGQPLAVPQQREA